MNETLRHLALTPLRAAGWLARALREEPGGSFRFLLLHDVRNEDRPALEALVDRIVDSGRMASPSDVERCLAGSQSWLAPSRMVVTFDDGFRSNVEVAETILARRGIKALFFICPGLMALSGDAQRTAITSRIFDGKRRPADLPDDLRLMTWDDVERLVAGGHTVGSHSLSHRRLAGAAPDVVANEVEGAARSIEERLGHAPAWFAFPFGDIGSIDTAALRFIARRHRYCRSRIRGRNLSKMDPMALFAEHVDLGAPRAWQWAALNGDLDLRYARSRQDLAEDAAAIGS